jgi:hypothetical protein
VKILLNRLQVGDQERELLFRSSLGSSPEKDNRWPERVAQCEQRTKVGIGRDKNAVFGGGMVEDLAIRRRLHREFANVDGAVARCFQPLRNKR